jgi:hypothetical protein
MLETHRKDSIFACMLDAQGKKSLFAVEVKAFLPFQIKDVFLLIF